MSRLRYMALSCLLLITGGLYAQQNEITNIKHALPAITDSMKYVDALNRLSACYIPCQLDSSGAYAIAANTIATSIGYEKGRRNALRGLGRYYSLRPHRYLSFLFYGKALEASRAAGDSAGVVAALMNIGNYYQYQGNHPAAQYYVSKALKVAWDQHLDSLRAWVLINYYMINAADTSVLPVAQKALQQAVALTSQYNDDLGSLYVKLFLAHETLRAGNAPAAEAQLKGVIATADHLGLNYIAMYACTQLAGYLIWQKRTDSLQYQQQSLNYAVAGGYTGLMLPAITTLFNWYQQQRDSLRAAGYSQLALQVMQQQQEDIQEGEADYLSYVFGDELMDSLRTQYQLQHAKLQQGKSNNYFWYYQVIIITAIAMLLAVLLLYFVRAYRLSRMNAASMAVLREEIRKSNKALQESDDFKNKLISMIAHDFRTPLHNIVNITGFIEEEALTVTDAADMILQVETSAAATLTVFEEILAWIRTQLSGFVYRPGIFLLSDMIDTTVNNLHHLLAEKDIQVQKEIPDAITVSADYEMLQFIHRNFLHNAIKFSPQHSTITVTAIREKEWLQVAFKDAGTGIDTTVLSRLFSWNSQAEQQERPGKGAGVALIICKDFIEKMGGTISANNNQDRGSTFFYRLPQAKKMVLRK